MSIESAYGFETRDSFARNFNAYPVTGNDCDSVFHLISWRADSELGFNCVLEGLVPLKRIQCFVDRVQIRASAAIYDVSTGSLSRVRNVIEFDVYEYFADGVIAPGYG